MSSRTWSAKTAVVTADKELASVIVRLMMAMNDIALANEGLSEWIGTTDRRKVYLQNGGRLYYGRMLMAHIYEALSIIEDIQQDPKLRDAVQQLRSQDALLLRCRRGVLGHGRLQNAAAHPKQRLIPL